MIEILILYMVFSYFCYAGIITRIWDGLADNAKIGGVICFTLAPISLPITVGVYFAAKP